MTEIDEIKKILNDHTKILKNIEKHMQSKNLKQTEKKIRTQNESKKKSTGLKGAILELKKELFFKMPKELGEIRKELEAKAVFHPRTNYPHVLLDLIREKELRRIKQKNKWKYVNHG